MRQAFGLVEAGGKAIEHCWLRRPTCLWLQCRVGVVGGVASALDFVMQCKILEAHNEFGWALALLPHQWQVVAVQLLPHHNLKLARIQPCTHFAKPRAYPSTHSTCFMLQALQLLPPPISFRAPLDLLELALRFSSLCPEVSVAGIANAEGPPNEVFCSNRQDISTLHRRATNGELCVVLWAVVAIDGQMSGRAPCTYIVDWPLFKPNPPRQSNSSVVVVWRLDFRPSSTSALYIKLQL